MRAVRVIMPKAASKTKSFRRQGITILVLLMALGIYFAVIVPSQKAFLIKRNFRVLADMGMQINEALANLGSSLNNAMRPPPDLSRVDTNGSPYLTAIVRDNRDLPSAKRTAAEAPRNWSFLCAASVRHPGWS
jgi:hypothetical protein